VDPEEAIGQLLGAGLLVCLCVPLVIGLAVALYLIFGSKGKAAAQQAPPGTLPPPPMQVPMTPQQPQLYQNQPQPSPAQPVYQPPVAAAAFAEPAVVAAQTVDEAPVSEPVSQGIRVRAQVMGEPVAQSTEATTRRVACPRQNCRTANPFGSKFCWRCGAILR
jgi:hypothetical protein